MASDGGVFSFGDAQFWGSTGGIALNKPIVGMAATPDGDGYWLVASDGGIFAFGDAQFFGSTGGIALNKPIVGMAADGGRQRLLARGVRRRHLRLRRRAVPGARPAASTSTSPSWAWRRRPTAAATGSSRPTAASSPTATPQFWGSTGSIRLNEPIVGMAPTPDGNGYWLVGQDAGVFTYGDAVFSGSAQSPLHPPLFPQPLSNPIAPVVAIINEAPGPQATHQGVQRVAFAGDSLALYEGHYVQETNPPYVVDDGAAAGCGFTNGAPTDPWSDPGSRLPELAGACALWATQLQWVVSRFHPDVTVIQTGYWETQDRQFDGSYTTLANPAYAAYIEANLAQAVQIAHSDGGAVILSTSPYFDDGTPSAWSTTTTRSCSRWPAQYPYVSIDDLYTVLDPGGAYASVVDGIVARSADGVHITQAAVDNLIEPALNQIIANVAGAVYAGGA